MRLLGLTLLGLAAALSTVAASSLPESVVFVGKPKFYSLVQRGSAENWRALPIGERTARAGMALTGTPYKNYTLELDDHIETPCVNMNAMDCWTFFEIALASARALREFPSPTSQDMLRLIEIDRYRGGRCTGIFTSRLHQLEDWLYDNQKRGLVKDITPDLPGARKLHRQVKDMVAMGSRVPQFRANPSLIPIMAKIENQLTERGIWYVPKSLVPSAEKYLRNGDIVCIVSTWPYSYTSHVGLAYRDSKGTLRFLHASKTHRKVVLDSRLSTYLANHRSQAGIMVARPNDL